MPFVDCFFRTLLVLIPLISPAQAADESVIRAIGAKLPEETVTALATAGKPTQLNRRAYPEAGRFSPREIAQILCGKTTTAYLDQLKQANSLSDDDLAHPQGEKTYLIKFPKCLFIAEFGNPITYQVIEGDTLSSIRRLFTGTEGNTVSNAEFFRLSPSTVASGRLPIGATVAIPFATTSVPATQPGVSSVLSSVASVTQNRAPLVQVARANDYVSVGETQPRSAGIVALSENPPDCGTKANPPFDAQAVAGALAFAQARAARSDRSIPPQPVNVLVVDNGFAGAQEKSPTELTFRKPAFASQFFYQDRQMYDPPLGPTAEFGDGIAPLDVSGGASPLNGHGTHVTGLVLGGPGFLPFRSLLAGAGMDSPALLKITEMNVGRGKVVLLDGSAATIGTQIGMLFRDYIINLSLEYGRSSTANFKDLLGNGVPGKRHLYVVAAGNDGRDAQNSVPASLGGSGSDIVLTVAALNPAGNLEALSNYGSNSVDIAAPGCRIASWIDMSGPLVELSGTSQATPIITFETVVMRTVSGAPAADLKAQAILSGDLLPLADRPRIRSHLKANIVRALYLHDDELEYVDEQQQSRRVLGVLRSIGTLACEGGGSSVDQTSLGAFKSDGQTAYAFTRDRNPPCPTDPAADIKVAFEQLYSVPPPRDAKPDLEATIIEIPLARVRDITTRLIVH